MSALLTSLQAKRDILKAKIEQEASRPNPCSLRLQALKRQRLRLKDRLVALTRAGRELAASPLHT